MKIRLFQTLHQKRQAKLNKAEIIEILSTNESDNELFSLADNTRKKYVGDEVHLRALIEISNICKNSCKYCGLRLENNFVERYKMTEADILKSAKQAYELGFKTIVLQSGESSAFSVLKLCKIIEKIKNFDVAITLSLGEYEKRDLKEFYLAGADRYLLRIETTDEDLYQKMHPNMDLKNRKRVLYDLKDIGYEVGTGSLVGLPHQSINSLADDILFFNELSADMIGIGPFIAHPNTPLSNFSNGDLTLSMKIMALCRLTLKNINIPATTAMETLQKNGRILALQRGANVVMPNLSDASYSKNYEIYPNKAGAFVFDINERLNSIVSQIKSINRTIAKGCGNSPHKGA